MIATINGTVQISAGGNTIGLLVERDGNPAGTLLDPSQARAIADALLRASTLESVSQIVSSNEF